MRPGLCVHCGSTGHYLPVNPHCEPCEDDWKCYSCEGSGHRYYRNRQRLPHPLDGTAHIGQSREGCKGCEAVKEAWEI